MYEEFFGLNEKPFSIQPDPSFLYWGRGHRLAYAMLEYGVLNHAGISVVTGEVGCGKTTLIHRLLDQLSDTHAVALLSNIQQGRGDLLSWVLMGFGQPFAGKTHVELFADLQNFFISEYSQGRRIVLIIDEAQNLSIDMLEELRMLSNINAGKDQLLQLILVGQPELKDVLNRPDLLQLAQRIGSDFHLTPLSRQEVDAYIETRLMIAGARRRIFTEPAVDLIAEKSRGVPRVINIIADTALVYGFSSQSNVVDVEIIRDVVRDKLDYGVFGIATEPNLPKPVDDESGPDEFIVRKDKAPGKRKGSEPRDSNSAREDTPRMPPPARRRSTLEPAAARAASYGEPANESQPETAPARKRVDAMPTPKRAPFAAQQRETAAATAYREPEESAYDETSAAPEPTLYPTEAAATPAPETRTAASVGVVVVGAGGSPEAAIRSAGEGRSIVFVPQSSDEEASAAARRAGADIVEIADRALSPGRARNAGYRQLKKRSPDLAYVQFVDAGVAIDPAWLATALRFMERRPEVAAVEGEIKERFEKRSAYNAAAGESGVREAGELQATGQVVLVRTDAFESAGGFRGDLPVNETRDLCIRFRRRGAHIWRLDEVMGVRDSNLVKFGHWWSRAVRQGYEYAHGAALHGGPPERLYSGAHLRAVVWGAILPAIVLLALAGGAAAAYALPGKLGLWVIGSTLVMAAMVYLARIIMVAVRRGPARGRSWAYAFLSTVGYMPEFFGAWAYHFGGAKTRQAIRPTA